MLSRERKKSQMAVDKIEKNERAFKLGLELNAVSYKNNIQGELKLPKVQNRYSKCKDKDKMNKQNSLRSHKIFS